MGDMPSPLQISALAGVWTSEIAVQWNFI